MRMMDMGTKGRLRIPLRIVFYREGEAWIAHCLEFDLMGDGATKEAACAMLVEAIGMQLQASIEDDNQANLFNPADGRILAMFAAGEDIAAGEMDMEFIRQIDPAQIEGAVAREYHEPSSSGMCYVH